MIQWKTTASLCSIWQRIGRAARGDGSTAKAVVFVEKKYLDVNRQKKDEKAAQRLIQAATKKRKASSNATNARPSKQTVLAPSAAANINQAVLSTSNSREFNINDFQAAAARDEEGGVAVELQRQSYHSSRNLYRSIVSDQKDHSIEPALDDMVNARTRGFNCRRQPPTIYFGNDSCGKCYLRIISHQVSHHACNDSSKRRPSTL